MTTLRSRLGAVAVGLALMITGVLAGATPAVAKDNVPGTPKSSCAGRVVKTYPIATKYGSVRVYVYYSSAHHGTNCIIAKKAGAWKGKKTFMNLRVERSDASHLGYYPYVAYDVGAYKSYAGAISIPNTSGRCVNIGLDLGSTASASSQFRYFAKYRIACG